MTSWLRAGELIPVGQAFVESLPMVVVKERRTRFRKSRLKERFGPQRYIREVRRFQSVVADGTERLAFSVLINRVSARTVREELHEKIVEIVDTWFCRSGGTGRRLWTSSGVDAAR